MIILPRFSSALPLGIIGPSLLAITAGLFIGVFIAIKLSLTFGMAHPAALGWTAGLLAAVAFGLVLALLAPAGRAVTMATCATLTLALALAVVRQGSPMGFVAHQAATVGGHPAPSVVKAAPLTAWGENRQGFQMHPRYEGAVTLDAIRLPVSADASSATLAVTQPEWALFRADGSATGGDGVEVVAVGVAGETRTELGRLHLRPAASAKRHWIDWTLKLPDGTSALEISVTPGPGASTTYHDSTFVGVSFASPWTWLAERGQRLLRILSLMLPLFAGWYLLIPTLKRLRVDHLLSPEAIRIVISLGSLILAVNMFVAYWTTHSRYIYIWDNFGYWGLVRDLAGTLRVQGLSATLLKVTTSLKDEYNLIPALPPAIFGARLPDIDRRAYITLLANLYFVPACLAVYWLVHIMLAQAGETRPAQKSAAIFPLVLCAIGLYPVFFRVVLWGQPDMGGVVLVVMAILLFNTALKNIADKTTEPASPGTVAKLFSQGVLLAFTLLLLVMFRRWYLFMAASLSFIVFFQFLAILVRGESGARATALQKGIALFSGGLIFLCASVPAYLIERIKVMVSNSYASAYAAYARDWSGEFNFLTDFLGIAPLSLGLLLSTYGLIASGNRSLRWLTLGSAPIALALFWSVQRGMGLHHLNLIFVGLTAGVVQGVWALQRRSVWPVVDSFSVAGTLLVLTIWTCGNQYSRPTGLPYTNLLPPVRNDIEELIRLGKFIAQETSDGKRRFCVVGSNYTITQDIATNLWQIQNTPDFANLGRGLVALSQVDSRDGPPETITQCDLVLVGEPVIVYLGTDAQRSVSLLAEDLLKGEGIGSAYRGRSEIFQLQDGITVKVFDRVRNIASAEWEQFLWRFNAPR
ncbi:hypothetical protein [Methylomagnum sp.]